MVGPYLSFTIIMVTEFGHCILPFMALCARLADPLYRPGRRRPPAGAYIRGSTSGSSNALGLASFSKMEQKFLTKKHKITVKRP